VISWVAAVVGFDDIFFVKDVTNDRRRFLLIVEKPRTKGLEPLWMVVCSSI
jgi:hypothetical protein